MNVALQLFTFDQTRRSLELLRLLDSILVDSGKARFVWNEHNGSRKTIALDRLLIGGEEGPTFNEAYVQASPLNVRSELARIHTRELTVHLSISPHSCVWARSTDSLAGGKPGLKKMLSYIRSLERAARFREPELMPTVLEITFKCDSEDSSDLINGMCETVKRAWPQVNCVETFGTIDCGGEWLFFPKSGYNPNTANIHAFFSVEARTAWPAWRLVHNASFASQIEARSPLILLHSLDQRRQSV